MDRAMDVHVSMPAYLRALGWVRELLALVDEYARESGGCDDGSERGGDDRPSTWWLREHDEARVELEAAALAQSARVAMERERLSRADDGGDCEGVPV